MWNMPAQIFIGVAHYQSLFCALRYQRLRLTGETIPMDIVPPMDNRDSLTWRDNRINRPLIFNETVNSANADYQSALPHPRQML